jgi:hypothetical protein
VWDEDRQIWRQVYLNYCGAEIDPTTDEGLNEMMQLYALLPRKYTESAMGMIGELINSHLTDPVIFDNQLFGPLIFLQNLKSNLAKVCVDQQTAIEDRIVSLTRRQLSSKASIDGMREMSRTTVMLWEIACLGRPGSKVYDFQRKMISYLRSRNAVFSTEADRSRILKQCDKIDDAIAASGSMSLDHFFNNLSDCFGDELFSTSIQSPTHHREVAFVADATCDHSTQGKNHKAGVKDSKTLTPMEQQFNDLKSQMGTITKLLYEKGLPNGQPPKKWNQGGGNRPNQQKGTSGKDYGGGQGGRSKKRGREEEFAGSAVPKSSKSQRTTKKLAQRPQDSDCESSGGEGEYGALAYFEDSPEDTPISTMAPIVNAAPESPRTPIGPDRERVDLYSESKVAKIFNYTPDAEI